MPLTWLILFYLFKVWKGGENHSIKRQLCIDDYWMQILTQIKIVHIDIWDWHTIIHLFFKKELKKDNIRHILLKDVLFVPSITKNLLSISKLTVDNNLFVEFLGSICFVKDSLKRKVLLRKGCINCCSNPFHNLNTSLFYLTIK